jgi:Ca2+:H+ antiporter
MPVWMYVLLGAGAAAIVARLLGLPPIVIFLLSAAGLVPMAALIGRATEALAHHVGPKFGGLLNATFGNAAELIIGAIALKEGLIPLVKASITGSIIGNSLLVLGMSVVYGGLRHGVQQFDAREATRNSTMMLIALASMVMPAVFAAVEPNHVLVEEVSVGFAAILLLVYGAYIAFSLTPAGRVALEEEVGPRPTDEVDPTWTRRTAVLVLLAATVGTVVLAEMLVGTVESFTHVLGWSQFFVGLVVVPIVGNIAEHFSAVQLAGKNKIETSIAIAAGSSTQIALLVAPILVLLGLVYGRWLTLVFHPLEIMAVGIAAFIFAFVCIDGESNWLEGVQLLALYLMLGIVFFFLSVE